MMAAPGQACDLVFSMPSSHQWHETPSDITASNVSVVVGTPAWLQAALVTLSNTGLLGKRPPVATLIATPNVLQTQRNSSLAAVSCLSFISDLPSLSISSLTQWSLPGLNWALAL